MKRTAKWGVGALLTLALLSAGTVAEAAPPQGISASQIEAAVQKADPNSVKSSVEYSATRYGRTQGVQMEGNVIKSGALTLALPKVKNSSVDVQGGKVLADSKSGFAVREQHDGLQVWSVALDRSAPSQFAYRFDGFYLSEEGAGVVVRKNGPMGEPIALIDNAWAKDAQGSPVRSWYSIEDNSTLVQHVEVSAATKYPVVADPRIRTAWYGVSIDFSRSDTAVMSAGAGGVAAVAALIPDPTASKVVAVSAGVLAAASGVVAAQGRCVSIKITWAALVNPALGVIWWSAPCYR